MTHAHTWHTIASYPWAKGMVYKDLCDRCGSVKKTRTQWPDLATSGRSPGDGGSVGSVGGFLVGIGFATFVFAVATLRGCG